VPLSGMSVAVKVIASPLEFPPSLPKDSSYVPGLMLKMLTGLSGTPDATSKSRPPELNGVAPVGKKRCRS